MDATVILSSTPTERWELAAQMGVERAATGLPREADDPCSFDALMRMQQRFADAGFTVEAIEDRPAMNDAMTGGPARDEQIDEVCRMLENLGRVGIPTWCPAWMAEMNWLRTSTSVPARGGSLTSGYDHELMQRGPPVGSVTEEELWENMEHFLERVIPVAEDAGVKLAWHPDDPPLSPIRGVGRILTSVENYDRLLSLYPSEYNGITLCQGNFAAMGADIPETIRHFGEKIHYVHFRDVEGTPERFVEVWQDEGPTDMLAAMAAYHDVGYDGVMRPDHVPTMAGEDNSHPGYHDKGRLYAVGYMNGLIEAVRSGSIS